MKREAFRHPKLLDLASRLGIPHAYAFAHVAYLLNHCADIAPQGNIGKWSNGVIARGAEWIGDPDTFVNALVDSGWLDRCAVHRLVIHDLKDHLENWWRLKLDRLGLPVLAAIPVADTSGEASAERSAEPSAEASPPRDQTKPNQTSNSCGLTATAEVRLQPTAEGTAAEPTSRPTATSGSADANGSAHGGEDGPATSQAKAKANGEDCPDQFEAFWQAYPLRGGRKRGKRTCLGIWRQVIRAADRQPLVEAARHYADSDESKRGFARDPERFLRNEWWRDWVPRLPMAPPAQAPALDVPHRIAKATFV